MAESEDRPPLDWRQIGSLALLILGGALVAVSFVWASWATGRSAWSDQQALEYQAASSKLHSLSHEFAHQAAEGDTEAIRPSLEAAQAQFGQLRTQLEAAQNRPVRVALVMRFAGLAMAVAGGTLYVVGDRG